jgi:hypothetical protein
MDDAAWVKYVSRGSALDLGPYGLAAPQRDHPASYADTPGAHPPSVGKSASWFDRAPLIHDDGTGEGAKLW